MAKTSESKELTAERFARFLAWLDPDLDQAALDYERLRFRLTAYFSARSCLFADDLSDEVINRVALKIGEEEIRNKTAYFFGVARIVLLEYLRKEKQHVNIDYVTVAATPEIEETDTTSEMLDKCLGELSPENRKLILDYMSENKQAKIDLHKRISESLKTSQTALRMRIVRIKRSLRICLEECMA